MTNIEVPYRVRFFNELAKHCDLTVLYESRSSASRNKTWAKSVEVCHKVKYLSNGYAAVSDILKEVRLGYDKIIVGCYNSPIQMTAILAMKAMRIPYIINLDGETFLDGNSLKAMLKRFFLSGAQSFLVAGEKSAQSVKKYFADKEVVPYYFSSLSQEELTENAQKSGGKRTNTILVVAQYLFVKGNDVVLEAARMDPTLHYKFVGMGSRTKKFINDFDIPENVEIIPFLQKKELEQEYQNCAMLVLPTRQECWGLVINEAASFGMPIVSTWGSGAAIEFLSAIYPQYLAKPGDPGDLQRCVRLCYDSNSRKEYGEYLVKKSSLYSIERSVVAHCQCLN